MPLVLDGEVFDRLAAAVTARMQAMEVLLADLYGPRLAVREGWVPAEALASSDRYRLAAVGAPPPPRWLTTYAVDVVAGADGAWRVVQDLADTPTGVGYALLDRSVMARVAAELLGPEGTSDLASISGFPAELRHALATLTAARSPRVVLLSGGVRGCGLRRALGARPDARVPPRGTSRPRRSARAAVAAHAGRARPIDVVYRRLPDAVLDPIEASAAGSTGVPGLALASSEGGVVLANGHGSGVLEDPDLAPFWAGGGRGADREAPTLASARDATTSSPACRRSGPARSSAPASSSACTPSPDPTA